MNDGVKSGYLWFKASIVLGMLLGLVLLAQSIFTYRYVANSMVRLEAKREADRKMQSIIRLSRTAGNRDVATLHPLMDELHKEAPQQIAWMRILDTTGREIIVSGNAAGAPAYAASSFDRLVEDRERPPAVSQTPGGRVLITLNPLYIGLPAKGRSGAPGGLARTIPGVGIIEIGIYLNGVSTRFGPLRENMIVGVSAALALWAAVIIIGFRFRSYLRGKKVEEQLAMARLVQFDLLPPGRLSTHDLEFAAQCVPAWQVGGDFYDAFETADHQVALVLGDVPPAKDSPPRLSWVWCRAPCTPPTPPEAQPVTSRRPSVSTTCFARRPRGNASSASSGAISIPLRPYSTTSMPAIFRRC